jgi:translocation and assembly module TamB
MRFFKRRKPDEPPEQKRRRGRAWPIVSLVLLGAIVSAGLYLRSDAFREYLRKKVVAELELITGAKVEIHSLTWRVSRLQVEATGVTVHGSEPPGQAPLAQVDRIFVQAKIISLFRREIGLRTLVMDHPVIHLIVNPDGTTNQPLPKVAAESGTPGQRLFDLAVGRIEINHAELMFNEQKLPFEFAGENLSGGISYSQAERNYNGNLSIGLAYAQYGGMQPLRGKLELAFLLRPSQVEFKSIKLTAGHSVLEAAGTVNNYYHPVIHARYKGALDLAEVARSARIQQLRGGRLDIEGTGNYMSGRYEAKGQASVHHLSWHGVWGEFTGIDAASPFLITPEKISLARLTGDALAGRVQGQVEIVNWNAPVSARKTPERGAADLQISGMQAGQIGAALSTSRQPFDRIRVAGAVSGGVKVAWTGTLQNLSADIALQIEPAARPTPQEIPLTGRLQGKYHHIGETIDLAELSLATRDMRLSATGTLGSDAAQLKIAFNANNVQELRPILQTLTPSARVPLDVHGRASFNGALYGKLAALSARGHLDLQDFDSWSPMPQLRAGSGQRLQRIHLDSLIADVLLTPSGITAQNGTLKRGPTQVNFSGSAGLNKGRFNEATSQVTGNFQVLHANLADLQSLAGTSYSMTGVLDADVRARGTLQNLRGSGSVQVSRVIIYGEPYRLFRADVAFAGDEAQFNKILLSHNGSQLSGSASFNLTENSFRFDLNGANIDLAGFHYYQPRRLTVAGHADFHVSGSGTPQSPQIDARLALRRLVLNGEMLGDLNASAETHGENMLVRAESNFENASFSAIGSLRLRDNFPGQVTIKFQQLHFDPLLNAYLQRPLTGHSSVEGYIEVRGPMRTPRSLTVLANISQLSANLENVKMRNEGPLRFSFSSQSVHVDQFHLSGDDLDFSVHGDANMFGTRKLDLHADGKVDLKLLQTFNRDIASSGAAALAIHMTGTTGAPQVRGSMDITNGSISVVDLPNGLTQINGRLVFAEDRMQIEKLRAHTGGGDLDLGGFIAYRNGLYFDVTATGKEVRVRYPPGLSASGNASFRYTGSWQGSLLSGDVTLVRFAVDPRFDFAQYLARSKNPVSGGTQNAFLENLRLDVHIVSTPGLRVETSLARIAGDVDLRIRGTVANPAVLGRVNISEGSLSFSGTKYRLERGDVTFSNPQVIQPVVNVEIAARVRDYDITIGFHGPVDKLRITYRSDPPLSSGDIIALLAFGRTKQEDIYNSYPLTQPLTTSDTILQQALSDTSSSRVQKLFGASNVKIDPQAIGPENNIGPRLTIEQQIQNNITLTYITNLAQSTSEQAIQMEYYLTRSISIVGLRDQFGIVSFEVRIRKRKR